jgi:hypothetical protein
MAQEVILIIGIPNVACNGVKQVTKAVGIQKKFMYIHYVTYVTHLLEDGMDIITLKDLWDIRTLNFCPNPIFMWFYFTR